MSLKQNAVLGIAMGTSEATGYVDAQGRVTSWLNELAFAPVDYSPKAPVDEWSGDFGCGVQYFSQQAVGRLIPKAGLEIDPRARLARKTGARSGIHGGRMRTSQVNLSDDWNLPRLRSRSLCLFLYPLPCLDPRAVTSGEGGTIILEEAQKVLRKEFPDLNDQITFHQPDEKNKRHGQAIAAASLPSID